MRVLHERPTWRALFGHVLEHHVDVVVEAAQRSHNLLVASHDHPHARADALVDNLCGGGGSGCGDPPRDLAKRVRVAPRGRTCAMKPAFPVTRVLSRRERVLGFEIIRMIVPNVVPRPPALQLLRMQINYSLV